MNQDKSVADRISSLSSPLDVKDKTIPIVDKNAPILTEEETKLAVKDLNCKSLLNRYPTLERRLIDPPFKDQKYFLISFVPSKGATPDEQGIFGFAKVRGVFSDVEDADDRAEHLIKSVDSYHKIFHGYIGRPFPLTLSSDFSKDIRKVDLKKAITDSVSEDIRKKRIDEQKEIEEIKEREKVLLEDVKKNPEEDLDDRYVTLRVKLAQLRWTYSENSKKLNQMLGLMAKAQYEIEELDEKQPELMNKYFTKYMDARKQAGLSTQDDTTFIKYMIEDIKIEEAEKEFERIYGRKPLPLSVPRENQVSNREEKM